MKYHNHKLQTDPRHCEDDHRTGLLLLVMTKVEDSPLFCNLGVNIVATTVLDCS